MMTCAYPPASTYPEISGVVKQSKIGMIHALNDSGYQSAVYGTTIAALPTWQESYEHMGFQKVFSPETQHQPASGRALAFGKQLAGGETWVDTRLREDREAMSAMTGDMNRWIERDQRYVAVYLPQLSHWPWADLQTGGKEADPIKRGRSLMVVLDRWLGEILKLLAQKGRLNRTLIVVTADHGLRTSDEVSGLTANLMDDYAFHVPFLLYAPILAHSEEIPYLTSHIDIGPSILDLLGIARGREMEQGSPLWDQRIASRTTFFLENLWAGNDGFHSRGMFFGWNRTADILFSNSDLHFSPGNVVAQGSPKYLEATQEIIQMDAIRVAWFNSLRR
jgi:membrane-anchored protein YejM (alkaline phosphatase superfamily)